MPPRTFLLLVAACLALARPFPSCGEDAAIDPARGRELMQKSSRGETLTPDELTYLDRVKQAIRERNAARAGAAAPGTTPKPIEPNTADWSALIPLTDLTSPYKGEDGGLYGGGHNDPPETLRAAHLQESAKIRPLDATGTPAADGKIGLITIGFSNTSIESEDFKRTADADPQKSPQVVIVNGAIGGRSAVMWAWDGADVLPAAEQQRLDREMDAVQMPKGVRKSTGLARDTWPTLAQRIAAAGLAPAQVQAVWLKRPPCRDRAQSIAGGATAARAFPAPTATDRHPLRAPP